MERLKFIIGIITCFVFGFGLWYLIFWFITAEPNLFVWGTYTKIVYLTLSFLATAGISNQIIHE